MNPLEWLKQAISQGKVSLKGNGVVKWPRCDHASLEVRVRTIKSGQKRLVEQCLVCGKNQFRKHEGADLNKLPTTDETINERWNDALDAFRDETLAAYKAQSSRDHEAWWAKYKIYLESPEWQHRRKKVLERANFTCEACLDARATEVHHTTYEHVFNEPLFELRAVCTPCHELITSLDRAARRPTPETHDQDNDGDPVEDGALW